MATAEEPGVVADIVLKAASAAHPKLRYTPRADTVRRSGGEMAAGVTKTTFYKHFESRDELLVAAIRRRDEWETQALLTAVEKLAGDDSRAQLLAFFGVLDLWFSSPDFRGCQFLNAAAEFPKPHDPVHAVAAEHKRKTRDFFRDLATSAGAANPETFADQYTALVEGTLILRQVRGRDDAARVMKPAVERLVAEAIPLERSGAF